MRQLNLIPYSLKEKKVKEQKLKDNISIGIIFLCLLFICIYIPKTMLSSLRKKEDNLRAQVALNSKILTENENINNEISNIKTHIAKAEAVNKEKVAIGNKITGVEKYVPADVVFNSMSVSKGTINITASTSDYKSISEFIANLQTSNDYKNSKLISISSTGVNKNQTSYIFTLTVGY